MGTKPKFWFSRNGAMWLFKATRPGQGEHWAEVLASKLADMLGLPHAAYELASWRGSRGVITPRFTLEGFDLVHGNELLAERDPEYPLDGARFIRTQAHTIDAVRAVIGDKHVRMPLNWTPPSGVQSAADVFGGYLLLDAWIGNTDRHHENWGLVVGTDARYLAPTFDHASSLGAHETDANKAKRLTTRDPGFSVAAYVRRPRVRSALYRQTGDPQPLGLVEAFSEWARNARCDSWLDRLADLTHAEILAVAMQFASPAASGPSLEFAQAILMANRQLILEAR